MTQNELISALEKLGERISVWLNNEKLCDKLTCAINNAITENDWFTCESIKKMLSAISSQMLYGTNLKHWISKYEVFEKSPKRVGIIAAGNIPLVFFHDLICVLISGNIAVVKLSSKDKILPECVINLLIDIEPRLKNFIEIAETKSLNVDAVIATGSDNTFKFFEEEFGEIPHIFRKNRTSVAIIKGDENLEQLALLGEDIFSFFGLGCRNVSKIFIPNNYDFAKFMKVVEKFSEVKNHEPYMNAYRYNRALLKINGNTFIDNKFWLLTENFGFFSPVSVIYYEKYSNLESINKILIDNSEQIQCVVNGDVDFGESQKPQLNNYADGIDVMNFLLKQI